MPLTINILLFLLKMYNSGIFFGMQHIHSSKLHRESIGYMFLALIVMPKMKILCNYSCNQLYIFH
jgi:hypothetical protein